MRRVILIILVIVLAYFGYLAVSNGVKNDSFNIDIVKYKQVELDSESMTKELAEYNQNNGSKYDSAKTNLTNAMTKYEKTKEQYVDLIQQLGIQEETKEEIVAIAEKPYKIDFLWAIIGNYATKEGLVDLDLVFVESTKTKSPSDIYIYADLKFTVAGDYILIANFLYDLEDDDRLAFEINDYYMVQDRATFVVYDVPIESESLLPLSSGTSSGNSSAGNSNGSSSGIPNLPGGNSSGGTNVSLPGGLSGGTTSNSSILDKKTGVTGN